MEICARAAHLLLYFCEACAERAFGGEGFFAPLRSFMWSVASILCLRLAGVCRWLGGD
jgi:hypothetical protein